MTDKELDEMVDRAAEQLGEHTDAVIVLACRGNPNDGSYTQIFRHARGNYFTQQGMLAELKAESVAATVLQKLNQRKPDAE